MVWYEHMVLGKGCESKVKKIRHRIAHRRAHAGVWLIVLPRYEHQVLEILPSTLMLQEHYPTKNLTVIGMAFTHKEAVKIAADLVASAFRTRGDTDVAAYLGEYNDREMVRP